MAYRIDFGDIPGDQLGDAIRWLIDSLDDGKQPTYSNDWHTLFSGNGWAVRKEWYSPFFSITNPTLQKSNLCREISEPIAKFYFEIEDESVAVHVKLMMS